MKRRLAGPDIIRCIAITGVLSAHMLSYAGHFDDLHTVKWYIYIFLHYGFLAAVPLFLLLTGYLNCEKKLSKGYFKGIAPILVSYALISVISILADRFIFTEKITLWSGLLSILNFTAIDYAWYVEMYIGLFLLIPFLNLLKDALADKKQWHMLIVTLLFITTLPDVADSFIFGGVKINIIPDWWKNLYPVTFYFLGAYIKKFKPQVKRIYAFAGAVATLILSVGLCALFSQQEYAWWVMNGISALPTAVVAVCVFLMFYRVESLPKIIGVPVRKVAVYSYEMYLFSYITDKYLYSTLRFGGIVTLIINFAVCFVLAYIVRSFIKKIFAS